MKTYTVWISVDASICVDVEANSKDEAKEKVWETASRPSVCHQCSNEISIGDLLEVLDVEEKQ